MENKFKVGDKVRVKNNLRSIKGFVGGYISDLEEYVGKIVTIRRINGDEVYLEENAWTWDIRAFERIDFTKDDLKDGDIVTLRNGDRLILFGTDFFNINKEWDNCLDYLREINEDLTYYDSDEYFKDNDIVKVERAFEYNTLFERNEEVKEMTIAEISKALGYEVKIVKEEN